MEIDVEIERIDNGYIVTSNDSARSRTYYRNLEDFATVWIVETLREADKSISHCEPPAEPFTFKLKSDL